MKKKPRVIWVTEDCEWKTLREEWAYTKKDVLAMNDCPKCRAIKFVEVK